MAVQILDPEPALELLDPAPQILSLLIWTLVGAVSHLILPLCGFPLSVTRFWVDYDNFCAQ